MKVLVTNDDGVYAEGIKILVQKLQKYASDIYVVAPSKERSATSHSLTIRDGLKLEKVDDIIPNVSTYSLSGSPADCVVFAINELKLDFDVVFSGINKGYNLGDDIIYSGTFAAAQEAVMKKKKGVSISCKYTSFQAAEYFDEALEYILSKGLLSENAVINVNLVENAKGIKITHQSKSAYDITFNKKEDGLFYSNCEISPNASFEPYGDISAIKDEFISISLLGINYTDWELFKKYH